MEEKKEIIRMSGITKSFFIGSENETQVLKGIDLVVREGEFVAIVGASGSGKSTLMNIIGSLDRPTTGEYTLDGINVIKAKDSQLSTIRNKEIGFVFQSYNLIAKTNVQRNVEMPMLYAGVSRREAAKRAKELLELVEMEQKINHMPEELSGGQKQRAAIARALANNPALILADEPTGALDSSTGRLVMDLFHKLHNEHHKTIVLITHATDLAEECERIVFIKDGLICDERKGTKVPC